MKVSFRAGRYLVALLWSWSIPGLIGGAFGYALSTWQVLEVLKATDELFFDALDASIHRVTESCSATDPKPTSGIDHPERSDPSEDLVSQHWRKAASLWVARRCRAMVHLSATVVRYPPFGVARNGRGGTLTMRCTNVQKRRCS